MSETNGGLRGFVAGLFAGGVIGAALALLYSIWAITGVGWEAFLWGIVLLAVGVPVFLLLRRQCK